jgi:HECT-domain (ubiquitin-transferase)
MYRIACAVLWYSNIIGGAMYTRANLSLAWPRLGWKRLLGETPTVEDLRQVSAQRVQFVLEQRACSREQRELYNSLAEEEGVWLHWSMRNVVGQEVELATDGAQRRLLFGEQTQWADAYLRALLDEGRPQWEAIRRGLVEVVPAQPLDLLNCAELAMFVRGAGDYSVDHLRANIEVHDELRKQAEWMFEVRCG